MFRKSGCLESTLRFRNTFVHNCKNRLKAWLLLLLHLWKVLYSWIDGGKISSLLYADLFRLTQFVSAKVPLTRLTKMWFWHLDKQVSGSGKLCHFNVFFFIFSPFFRIIWQLSTTPVSHSLFPIRILPEAKFSTLSGFTAFISSERPFPEYSAILNLIKYSCFSSHRLRGDLQFSSLL